MTPSALGACMHDVSVPIMHAGSAHDKDRPDPPVYFEHRTPKLRRGPQGTDSRLPHNVRCGPSPPALCSVRHTHDTPLPGPPPALRSTSIQLRDNSLTDRVSV